MKKLFEKLKHPNEKTKHRLQGVAIGFLFGAVLTLTCVGVVGCSLTQGEDKQPQARKLVLDVDHDLTNSTWTLNNHLEDFQFMSYDVNFLSNDESFKSIWGEYDDDTLYYTYDTDAYSAIHPYDYDSWQNTLYKTINIIGGLDATNAEFIGWLNANAVYDGPYVPVTSSSEATTSETTSSATSEATTSATTSSATSEATTSAPETTSLDQSLGFVFNDNNPFSAWAVNPLSGDPAVNYDGGAPWLLYTGKPSGSGATTAQTALSTDFAVGSFYISGNPSQTFDTIRVVTLNLTTDNAFILNGSTDAVQISADQFARGAFMVSEVQYRNSQISAGIKVYNFGLTSAKLNGQDINALTSGSWLNVGYRSIVWTGGGDLTINGYSAPASWWLENNALSSASAVSTMILGNSSTGVFGLLASAFTCWGSIFGLALVPGLTIGTLLFVPLVVLVIFSIIKLLQK